MPAGNILSGTGKGEVEIARKSCSVRGTSTLAVRLALGSSLALAGVAWSQLHVTSDVHAALDRISADTLREHVSFRASDLPGGRYTPSPGLEAAAEYIAARFRRAGLEPAGDDGYFQNAAMVEVRPNLDGFEFL